MAKDRQTIVKAILGAWIRRQYGRILPHLTSDVAYLVGEGAAKSIAHTAGIFVGKDKVKLWYDSHTWMSEMYGESVVNPLCGMVKPPQVVTYEDKLANIVCCRHRRAWRPSGVAVLVDVDLGVQGDLVCRMQLIANSVGGLDQFAEARRKQIATLQAAQLKMLK